MAIITNIREGERYRQAFARDETTSTVQMKVPVGYGKEAIIHSKPGVYSNSLVPDRDPNGGKTLKPMLRVEPYHALSTPVVRTSPIFSKIRSVESIARESDSPLVEKIHFANGGEIELRVENGQMNVYSRGRNSYENQATYTISKTLKSGISSREAIRNAEAGIFSKLADMESKNREMEKDLGLGNYFSTLLGKKKLSKEKSEALLEHATKEVEYNALVGEVNNLLEKTDRGNAVKQAELNLAAERAKYLLNAEFYDNVSVAS